MTNMRILAAQINPTIGDLEGNTQKILDALERAKKHRVDLVLFPELTLSGYFPEDLLLDPTFIDAIEAKLERIRPATQGLFVAVGLPRWNRSGKEKPLYNSAAVFIDGKLVGFKDKTLLPTYDVFDERRFFEPGQEEPIWEYQGKRIGIQICEDAWQHAHRVESTDYRIDPVMKIKENRPDLLLNMSGSPYYYKRTDTRLEVFKTIAKTLSCPVVFCNQVGANDQLVFDGHSLYIDAKGNLVQMAKGFVEEDFIIDVKKMQKEQAPLQNPVGDLYHALVLGVRDYFRKQGFQKGLLGLSGGIDSALVACIAKEALGKENVIALTMPSRYSSKGSIEDSAKLANSLGIVLHAISIEPLFASYLQVLEPLFDLTRQGLVEENIQSRIRGNILMAYSNRFGALVLNTSNKSEMAVGYCTLYGDMAGGLGVIHDVTKCNVYRLAEYIGIIPASIIQKMPSAELRENQTDLDTLPPYEVLDPIIEDYIEEGLSPEKIALKRGVSLEFVREIIHKIHCAEYKRRQAPLGIRVTKKAFTKGRQVPIVQKFA